MVTPDPYIPRRGDFVWVTFTPQAGHEQAGRRPALIVSPESYNRTVGLALFCPVTNQIKGYPFEVAIPEDSCVTGVVLSDQIRSMTGEHGALSLHAPHRHRSSLRSWISCQRFSRSDHGAPEPISCRSPR